MAKMEKIMVGTGSHFLEYWARGKYPKGSGNPMVRLRSYYEDIMEHVAAIMQQEMDQPVSDETLDHLALLRLAARRMEAVVDVLEKWFQEQAPAEESYD